MKTKILVLSVAAALAGCSAFNRREDAAAAQPPTLAEAHNALGLSLAAAGRMGEAVAQFQAAVALAPGSAYLHNNLGFAQLSRGAPEQAIPALQQSLRLNPAHPEALYNLALAQRTLTARPVPFAAAEKPEVSVPPVAAAPVQTPTVQAPPAPAAPLPVTEMRPYKLEVSNGNGIRGAARQLATWLAAEGLRGARVTNDRPFDKPATEVHYRAGYEAEGARVAALLPQAPSALPGKTLPAGIDVRVVLGGDRPTALALARS
jgi:tetratricopeptide (TPR) repeat protein